MEARIQELEDERNSQATRLLELQKQAEEQRDAQAARLLELQEQTEEAKKKCDAQATRLRELGKQEKDAEEEVRKKRDALAAKVREMEKQLQEETKKAAARVERMQDSQVEDINARLPLDLPTSNPDVPWDPWELDADFFAALSRWTLDNPESTLDRVFEKVSIGIEKGTPLFELIPDGAFPARGLVKALAHLLTLGVVCSSHSWFLVIAI